MNELSVPTLFEYTKSFDSVIFEERKPTIVLFTDFNDLGVNHLPIRDAFKAASQEDKLKGKIIFAMAGIKHKDQLELFERVGVTQD